MYAHTSKLASTYFTLFYRSVHVLYTETYIYIYIYIIHSMWTSQTSTRYVWEAEPGVPDE